MAHWFAPTGPAPLAVAASLLIAACWWALIHIPRHHTRTVWGSILRQFIAFLTTLVFAMLVIALALNRANGWYGSWTSLLGSGAIMEQTTVGAETPTNPDAQTPGEPDAPPQQKEGTAIQKDPTTNPAFGNQDWSDPTKGRYITVSIPESGTERTHKALIWLPPNYLSDQNRFHPVIVAFPGVPGSIETYQNLKIGETINGLVDAQKMRHAIVVIPDVFENNGDTECVDSTDGSVRTETWVTKDVTEWVKTNLRAADAPSGWTTLGYSAGGWCSTMLTMRHPELYSSAVSLAGFFHLAFDGPALRPLDDPAYNLDTIAETTAPDVRLWFWVAVDDAAPYQSMQRFAPHVRAPTSLTHTTLASGGHSAEVWTTGIPVGLEWLGITSPQFAWTETK